MLRYFDYYLISVILLKKQLRVLRHKMISRTKAFHFTAPKETSLKCNKILKNLFELDLIDNTSAKLGVKF